MSPDAMIAGLRAVPREARESVFANEQSLAVPIEPARRYRGWEVAALLFGKSQSWWLKHRKALLSAGFPRPISNTCNAPFYGQDLIDWLAREKSEAGASGFGEKGVLDLTAVLRARAAKLACK